MRVTASIAIGVSLLLSALACDEPEEAPAAAPAAAALQPVHAEEDEEELELMEAPVEADPTPLDEMDQAALETACFEGRQDACDRLGH